MSTMSTMSTPFSFTKLPPSSVGPAALLEAASYPPDEKASEPAVLKRQQEAGDYFYAAYIQGECPKTSRQCKPERSPSQGKLAVAALSGTVSGVSRRSRPNHLPWLTIPPPLRFFAASLSLPAEVPTAAASRS